MFKPPNCPTLAEVKNRPQIRLGVQGAGGSGKTHGLMSFRNPIVLNPDRGLGVHIGREDIIEVPIYDPAYCKTIYTNFQPHVGDEKIVIELWLRTVAPQLHEDQTLVVDGGTGMQNQFHKYHKFHPKVSAGGKINDFAEWMDKIEYFGGFGEMIKSFKCDVAFLMHETAQKDKATGEYTDKIRPLMTGQAGDQIVSHFTDWFRQLCKEKPPLDKIKPEHPAMWGLQTTKELHDFLNTEFPGPTIYYWQTVGDDLFDAKCSSLIGVPKFIPSNWKSFEKYMRKMPT